MRGSNPGPWIMLRRLREVMAEPIVAQDRLNKIVILIAGNMVAEVCSVYVMREHGVLELFATQGLKQEAVHTSKLRLGKGLVGLIAEQAEPLNLPNAQQHPSFAYLPETGEEIYQSFLGVPILRGGHTLGVLVVQNRAKRTYSEEEVEALQTTAMVIAELFASGELDVDAAPDIDIRHLRPHHLRGMPLSDGLGLGHAVFHEPRIVVRNLIAEDVEYEQKRLVDALGRLRASIDSMLSRRDMAGAGEHREVLDAYRMFAHDRGWSKRLREAVVTGLTAEAAVERVQNDYRARMMRQTDRYIRERLHDLDDLGNRLQRELLGLPNGPRTDLPKDAVIVARNMGPAELLDYDRERIRGLVLEEGGATSHVSIVAKALGIATVGQVANVLDMIDESDPIIVDGQTGDVHIRPQADVESAYVEKVRFRARRHAQYQKIRDLPAISRDGVKIDLFINSGLLVDLESGTTLAATGLENPQTSYGSDLISYASLIRRKPEKAALLQQLAIDALNSLSTDLCDAVGLKASDIAEMTVAGNTMMHHLLLGLPVRDLASSPFIPALSAAHDVEARDLGVEIAPGGVIHLLPNIAGFVGGDHVAALLATIGQADGPVITMDIGTNTELSLIRGDEIISVSCPSGPAFEGGNISCGMRAAVGAIESVRVTSHGVRIKTIEDAPAVGICGSGVLDVLAQMYQSGVIDKRGRMQEGHPRVREGRFGRELVLADEGETGGPAVVFTQDDVRAVQLAKAAIRAGCDHLLSLAGLSENDLDKVLIAGAFGSYIDVASAITAGLLPDLPFNRFAQVGNAAGEGARQVLLSRERREEAGCIALRARYAELASSKAFLPAFSKRIGFAELRHLKTSAQITGK